MRKMKILFATMLLSAGATWASDFSGKWTGMLNTDNGEQMPGYLVLQQTGEDIKGTAGPDAGHQIEIQNGHVRAGEASFEARPGPATLKFILRRKDEKLTGDVFEDGQRIGSATFQPVADH